MAERRRRIKIVSNGIGPGTRVIDVESGEQLDCVVGARWECRDREVATVHLELRGVPVELEGELVLDALEEAGTDR